MRCPNQKSALRTPNTTTQTIAANGFLSFATNDVLTGCAITHALNTPNVSLLKGLYIVSVEADVQATAAGDIAIQLLQDGAAINGAKATVTAVTGTTYHLAIPMTNVVVAQACPMVKSLLQIQLTAAGTVSNAILNVTKQA